MPEVDQYVARAKIAILEVLATEQAVVHAELEARISEGNFASSRDNIDPHHLTNALRELDNENVIIWDKAPAKGGHVIETIQPADQRRRATKIAHAAARKRLLAARYAGWSQGTKRHPQGLIGPAGEAAVRTAVLTAGTLQPALPDAGEVSQLLGTPLPGPADTAGVMVPFLDGIPGQPVTLIIEVKNIRGWIYPSSGELYQALHKASFLQLKHPGQLIMPVLACRKAHYTSYRMAKQLGFMVIEMKRQFAGDVEDDELTEVRSELRFMDLVSGTGPSLSVRDRLRKTLPGICTEFALTWRATCYAPNFAPLFEALRANISNQRRQQLVNQLRDAAADCDLSGGW